MSDGMRKLAFSLPFAMISIALFYLSSLPATSIPNLGFNFQDKVLHAAAYFVYGACTLLCVMAWSHKARTTSSLRITLLIASAYALSDEIHQYLVPSRQAAVGDWIADVIGIAGSLLLTSFFRRFFFGIR